jgi:hypothetical protein
VSYSTATSSSGGSGGGGLRFLSGGGKKEDEDGEDAAPHAVVVVGEEDKEPGNHQQHYLRSARDLQAPTSSVCTISKPSEVRAIYQVNQDPAAITVDGSTGDWDLSTAGYDYVTDLFNAGNADSGDGNFRKVAQLFLRWNCPSRKLCALVLTYPGFFLKPDTVTSTDDSWFKDYLISNSNQSPLLPAGVKGVLNAAGETVGWEGTCVFGR